MTVTIDLPPEEERKLAGRAASCGQDVTTYISRLVRQDLGVQTTGSQPNQATLALLARWDKEDETDDPAEIESRRREGEELQQALNRNREEVGARKLFP